MGLAVGLAVGPLVGLSVGFAVGLVVGLVVGLAVARTGSWSSSSVSGRIGDDDVGSYEQDDYKFNK